MDIHTSEDLFFSDLLKRFRKRKKMTQKQLAERMEVSRESISFWERGEFKPESDGILYQMVDVLGLTAQEQQQLFEAYTVTALATSFHNPPLKRNPYFTGRSSQQNQLHTLLMAGKRVALTQAISGLGGIGKTQLALEYAYRHQKSYHDIFWARADTEESLMASYVLLADLLHLPEYEESDQNKVKEAVQYWLSNHTGWLLILDNIEDLNLLQQFVPIDRQGAVLLTTRRHVTEPVAQALELELLPENDAILFLLKRTKVLAVGMSLEDASDHDIEAARAITHLLGNLPLALDQAGAYILETPCSFAEYLALFEQYQDRLLQRRIGERIPTDHPESVTATFRLNFQQVQKRSKAAGELLRLCAFLASDAIPEEILIAGASLLGPLLSPVAADAFQRNQAIEALHAYSLIWRDPKGKTLSIHRLVQAVLKDAMDEQGRQQWAGRAVRAVHAALPVVKHENRAKWERILAHTLVCSKLIEQQSFHFAEAIHLLHLTGWYLTVHARFREAQSLLERALQISEHKQVVKHLATARDSLTLASLYDDQGKYEQAEPLYQRAISIFEQQLGPLHPDTATSLNNLGYLYSIQGRYEQAEPLFQRALSIRELQLGATHPDTATSLNNLAMLYKSQGKYEKAEPLYMYALSIREQQLGATHPDTATSLNNLATLYLAQGKYEQAEPLYMRVLAIDTEAFGANHPKVAICLNNLAVLYQTQGKYGEAEPLCQRALSIREQQLGATHPYTAQSLNNLATLYQAQGKYGEAESLCQHTLAICERVLSRDHPITQTVRANYISFLQEMGRDEEARRLEEGP